MSTATAGLRVPGRQPEQCRDPPRDAAEASNSCSPCGPSQGGAVDKGIAGYQRMQDTRMHALPHR